LDVLKLARKQINRAEKEREQARLKQAQEALMKTEKEARESAALDPIRNGFQTLRAGGILLKGQPFPLLKQGRWHELMLFPNDHSDQCYYGPKLNIHANEQKPGQILVTAVYSHSHASLVSRHESGTAEFILEWILNTIREYLSEGDSL
jgi:hypothetical protein